MKNKAKPRRHHDHVYSRRNTIVRALGFKTYGDYLNSQLWADIRGRILRRDKGFCLLCREKEAKQVHHIEYDEAGLSGAVLTGMISVCRGCHLKVEKKRGTKRRGFSSRQSMKHRLSHFRSHIELDREWLAACG